MGASCKTPWFRFQLQRFLPFLFRTCLGYNKHWAWDRVCSCVVNENGHGIMLRTRGDLWLDTHETTEFHR